MTMKNMYRLVVAVVALTIRLDARTLAGIFPECSVIHITFKDNLKAINHDKNSITIGFLRTTRVRERERKSGKNESKRSYYRWLRLSWILQLKCVFINSEWISRKFFLTFFPIEWTHGTKYEGKYHRNHEISFHFWHSEQSNISSW